MLTRFSSPLEMKLRWFDCEPRPMVLMMHINLGRKIEQAILKKLETWLAVKLGEKAGKGLVVQLMHSDAKCYKSYDG